MIYYTYKITNLINEKIYIGVHKTENLEDGYMGSGKVLNYAKVKHGIENFHKEILKFHETQEEMFAHEAELVTQDFLDRNDVYNVKLGGEGGWDHIHSNKELNSHIGKLRVSKFKELLATDSKFKAEFSEKVRQSNLIRMQNPEARAKFINSSGFTGKTHTDPTREKIKRGMALVNHQQGKKNSQFGTMWIYSDIGQKNKKIKVTDEIPEGWQKGMRRKYNKKS